MPIDPTIWIAVRYREYPSEAVVTKRWSTSSLGFPNFIEGRVRAQGWSDIAHALSDWKGNPEASVLSVQLEDADGTVRAIADSIGRSMFSGAETSLYLLSEAGRKAGLTPRVIHRGYMTQPPQLEPRRKATIRTADVVGSSFFNLNPEATVQKVFYSRQWLEAAGIVRTPDTTLGKPVNIVLGEHSDAGAINVNGTSAAKGMLPVDDLGDMIFTEAGAVDSVNTSVAVIPPPVLTAFVVGDPGTATYFYQVTMLTTTGETLGSNIVAVTESPTIRTADNYIKLTWTPPAGWEQVYADNAIAFRVCGRAEETPNHYLDLMNNDGTFVDPEYEYHDDDDNDVEKLPGPPAVGTATVVLTTPGDPTTVTTSSEWGVLCWALGYSKMNALYGSDLAAGATPARTQLDFDHPDLMTPESANWPYPDPWLELDDGEGGTIRVSAFFARGNLLKHHRDRVVTFAINGCGMTDTGDDTGDPITELSEAYIWIINELLLKDGGIGYRTGAFWPLEEYSDGTSILDTELIRAAQTTTVDYIGGRGYQFHLCLTQPTTVGQLHQWINTTFSSYTGQLDNGQLGLWVIDPYADPFTGRHYRQHIEVAGDLPAPQQADDEVENIVKARYDFDPDANEYRVEVETFTSEESRDMYGDREAARDFLGCRCTRDRTTFRDAMQRRLYLNRVTPVYQPLRTNLLGIEQPLGSLFRLTHPDGLGVNGYENRAFMVTRKGLALNGPPIRVTLVGRDLQAYLESVFGALGDETLVGDAYDGFVLGDETSFEPPPIGAYRLL